MLNINYLHTTWNNYVLVFGRTLYLGIHNKYKGLGISFIVKSLCC